MNMQQITTTFAFEILMALFSTQTLLMQVCTYSILTVTQSPLQCQVCLYQTPKQQWIFPLCWKSEASIKVELPASHPSLSLPSINIIWEKRLTHMLVPYHPKAPLVPSPKSCIHQEMRYILYAALGEQLVKPKQSSRRM